MRPEEPKQTENKSRQLMQISVASLIEEGGYSQLLKKSLYFLAALLFVFIIWASVTKIDEVAVSFGDVQPVQPVQAVQHLEGGIVAEVYVKNGDEVKAGDKLIKLNPEQVAAELQKAQGREITLLLDVTRLQAFIDGKTLSTIGWRNAIAHSPFNTPENHKKVEDMLRQSIDLFNKQTQERDNQRAIYVEKTEQRKAQLQQFSDSKIELEKKVKLDKEEEEMYGPLVKEGEVSRKDYLIAQRKVIEGIATLKQTEAKINEAKSALQESETDLKRLDASINKESLKELNTLNGQLLEVHYTIKRLSALSKRLVVTAPEAGLVKGLTVQPGSIIAPGDIILDIVPTQGSMMVHCKISPHDIGHVRVGDAAKVKVMAYEFTRYGMIDGKVSEISASTFMSKDELPYYKAKVALSKNYVGGDPRQNPLKPGMTVEVDINTGKKSVIAYLINPITRGLEDSFRER